MPFLLLYAQHCLCIHCLQRKHVEEGEETSLRMHRVFSIGSIFVSLLIENGRNENEDVWSGHKSAED